MPFVFGGSPDAVAGQKNFYDAQNVRMAESDRALRQQAIDQYNQNLIAAQRQSEQDAMRQRELDSQAEQNYMAMQQGRADRVDDRSWRNFTFGVNRADTLAQDVESKRRFDLGEKDRADQFAFSKTQADRNSSENQLKDLVNLLKSGSPPSDTDLGTLFPSLTPQQVAYANSVAKQQKAMEAQEKQSMAERATHLVRAIGGVAPATPNTDTIMGIPYWSNAKPAKTLTEDEAFKYLIGDKELRDYSDLLQWDQPNQRFILKQSNPAPAAVDAGAPSPLPAAAPTPLAAGNPFPVASPPTSPSRTNMINAPNFAPSPFVFSPATNAPQMKLIPLPQQNAVARPMTTQELDALPLNAMYINPKDGKTYRKQK